MLRALSGLGLAKLEPNCFAELTLGDWKAICVLLGVSEVELWGRLSFPFLLWGNLSLPSAPLGSIMPNLNWKFLFGVRPVWKS